MTLVIGTIFSVEHMSQEKDAALKLSHDEVRRLAALAERERIGRDLHDLLGHTLSLVALKSELAGKLLERDPQAARREIDEVAPRRARGAGPGAPRGHRHPRRRPRRRTGLGAAAAGIRTASRSVTTLAPTWRCRRNWKPCSR